MTNQEFITACKNAGLETYTIGLTTKATVKGKTIAEYTEGQSYAFARAFGYLTLFSDQATLEKALKNS